MAQAVPHIHFLFRNKHYATALNSAFDLYCSHHQISYSIHQVPLSQLAETVQFDLVVSPATSYSNTEAGLDDAISRALSPEDDSEALTRFCLSLFRNEHSQFEQTNSGTLTKLPLQLTADTTKNAWGVNFIYHYPTTRLPSNSQLDDGVAYKRTEHLLSTIAKHNRSVSQDSPDQQIKSILLSPMSTGDGSLRPDKWASQTVLALKHHLDNIHQSVAWQLLHDPIIDGRTFD